MDNSSLNDNLHFFFLEQVYYHSKSQTRNIHFPDFKYQNLISLNSYNKLEKIKLFENIILTKDELFPNEKKIDKDKKIHRKIEIYSSESDKERKILLLGVNESCKLTILNHMLIIFNCFLDSQKKAYKNYIHENICNITHDIGKDFTIN